MQLLLDTHIFLWFLNGDPQLSQAFCNVIKDPKNSVYLSVVSIWEAIIKYQLGKLPLPESPEIYLPKQRDRHKIMSLMIDEKSVLQLIKCKNSGERVDKTLKSGNKRNNVIPINRS